MTLEDLNISQRIMTDKSKSEIKDLLINVKDKRKIKTMDDGLIIHGKTFYNFEFLDESTHWKITVKPKKSMLIIHVMFLLIWAIVGGIQVGWIFSILSLIGVIAFGTFVHKGLMTEYIKELSEHINN